MITSASRCCPLAHRLERHSRQSMGWCGGVFAIVLAVLVLTVGTGGVERSDVDRRASVSSVALELCEPRIVSPTHRANIDGCTVAMQVVCDNPASKALKGWFPSTRVRVVSLRRVCIPGDATFSQRCASCPQVLLSAAGSRGVPIRLWVPESGVVYLPVVLLGEGEAEAVAV